MRNALLLLALACTTLACTFVIVVGPNENDVNFDDVGDLSDFEDAGACDQDADAGCPDAGEPAE